MSLQRKRNQSNFKDESSFLEEEAIGGGDQAFSVDDTDWFKQVRKGMAYAQDDILEYLKENENKVNYDNFLDKLDEEIQTDTTEELRAKFKRQLAPKKNTVTLETFAAFCRKHKIPFEVPEEDEVEDWKENLGKKMKIINPSLADFFAQKDMKPFNEDFWDYMDDCGLGMSAEGKETLEVVLDPK